MVCLVYSRTKGFQLEQSTRTSKHLHHYFFVDHPNDQQLSLNTFKKYGCVCASPVTGLQIPVQVQFTIPVMYRTASTRFRFWQPVFHDEAYDVWVIDNLYVGRGISPLPASLVDSFDTSISTQWLWYPGGNRSTACPNRGTPSLFFPYSSSNVESISFVETPPLSLSVGDVISFDVSYH